MTVWVLGSINADFFYTVPHLPGPGETIAADGHRRGLGGKGANMAVAAARAAARVEHVGAVGPEGTWATDLLLEYGVGTGHITQVPQATGHAIICVDAAGENQIVIFSGANRAIPEDAVKTALTQANTGDWLLMQNETNAQDIAAGLARDMGLNVAYAAAPFDADAVRQVIPFLDLLVMNEVEAAQLEQALGRPVDQLGVPRVAVTLGADGCRWIADGASQDFPAYPARAVDSTGAGDTFTGFLVAGLDRGLPAQQALDQALIAGAIMVTREGTADVIPDLRDVQEFRGA